MKLEVKLKVISSKDVSDFNKQLEDARLEGWFPDGELIVSVVKIDKDLVYSDHAVIFYTMLFSKTKEVN